MNRGKLMLVDGNSLMNRAFYALPPLATSSGQQTNAVYGFLMMLFKVLEEEKPDFIAVAFDKSAPTFRHREYDGYKAGRPGMPDQLGPQVPMLKEVLSALGVAYCELEGYEADDLLGTIGSKAADMGQEVLIVTGDTDALQLVSERVTALLTRKGISELVRYDRAGVRERFGVEPEQMADVKGLMGDASDNIPGVPGVGEKTAVKLIKQYGSIEEMYGAIGEVQGERLRETLLEYREQAQLSKRLATIHCEVPVEFDLEKLRRREPDWPRVEELFASLEFKSLLQRIHPDGKEASPAAHVAESLEPGNWELIDSAETLEGAMSELRAHDGVAVAFEFEGHPAYGGALSGLAFCPSAGKAYCYLPHEGRLETGVLLEFLAPILGDPGYAKLGHDVKPLLVYLRGQGIVPRGIAFDSAVGAYLLNPTRASYPLSDLAREYLGGTRLPGREQLLGKGRGALSFSGLPRDAARDYLCSRAEAIYRIHELMREDLRGLELISLFDDVEMPLVEVLAQMEADGIRVEPAVLEELSREYSARILELTREIWEKAGCEFNINSTRQLGQVLFERLGLPVVKRTKTGYSTDVEVLETLAGHHPVVPLLLEYRQLVKLQSTYVEGLKSLINPATGRVHTSFNQTVTATGRLSSAEPNLQNIPVRVELGRRIRKAFMPREGWRLLVADYSQMELRILAHVTKDRGLFSAFRAGEDIHTRTASEVFGVPPGEVTPEMRNRAKAVNFGIAYGITDYGLARDIGVGRKEAEQYIENYFKRYPGVKEYMQRVVREARETGFVTTLLKRRRYLPDLHNRNRTLRSFAERTAINTPIQGSAADIIKAAMVKLHGKLVNGGYQARMLLQVHDELVLELPPGEVAEVPLMVKGAMENAVQLEVPLQVELKTGPNWYELSPFVG